MRAIASGNRALVATISGCTQMPYEQGSKSGRSRRSPINFPFVPGTQGNGLSRVKAERIDEQIRKTYTAEDVALLTASAEENPGIPVQCARLR